MSVLTKSPGQWKISGIFAHLESEKTEIFCSFFKSSLNTQAVKLKWAELKKWAILSKSLLPDWLSYYLVKITISNKYSIQSYLFNFVLFQKKQKSMNFIRIHQLFSLLFCAKIARDFVSRHIGRWLSSDESRISINTTKSPKRKGQEEHTHDSIQDLE